MSAAAVCGKRRLSYFEEISTTSPPYCSSVSKRLRCGNSTYPEQVNPPAAAASSQPDYRSEWVEVLLREMTSASTMDDAKARAYSFLEGLEKSIRSDAATEAAAEISSSQNECTLLKQQLDTVIQENTNQCVMLKQQLDTVNQDNTILKKGICIQQERQKKTEEHLRNLEIENYGLQLHLRQATQVPQNNISGHFPDVC
ncbi:hypothetical protein MKW92_049946 [Papaver armeniacum]|nr:hypothetical protein MKW92_049946 [Papaver armeniacum]